MPKALIAMSGGVDSSVAALLMKQSGFDCTGVNMRLISNEDIGDDGDKSCCSLDSIEDARSVCRRIGIPFHVFNFTDTFKEKVIDKFILSYENGYTPNPCIDCNRYLKFSKLFQRMEELSCNFVVTGHYARVGYDEKTGRYTLSKAVDAKKDQSYVLYNLTQEQLSHLKLPLGEYTKPEIREIAEQNGFVTASKSDSQDICFVPDGDYGSFIERYTGKKYEKGDFTLSDGTFLGKHEGIIRYTLGQRKGLGVPYAHRLYVTGKDFENNRVILGTEEDLYSSHLTASDVNWVSIEKPTSPIRAQVKVRYSQSQADALITPLDNNRVKVEFDTPQRAVTKGQAAVFYDGDLVLGGGMIE